MLTKETQKKERPSPADSAQTPNVFLPPQYAVAGAGETGSAPNFLFEKLWWGIEGGRSALFPEQVRAITHTENSGWSVRYWIKDVTSGHVLYMGYGRLVLVARRRVVE